MHGVDIYYIEDLLLTLGCDKFSHGNKKPDLAILVFKILQKNARKPEQ